jgi:hypothetical protein
MINLVVDFSQGDHKQKFFDILKSLKKVKYVVELKQYRENRSANQNRYYWGVVLEYLTETGFTKEEMHEVLKRKFNPVVKTLKGTGEEWVVGGSTTELDTSDMEDYLEAVRRFAVQELDILIPLPNETI